jgi:hypothetical protein
MRPWCNLAASHWRPYCASVNNHSPMKLVSWQWDAAEWTCVLCDRHIHNDQTSRSAHHNNVPANSTALMQAFLANYHITQVCQSPLQPRCGCLRLLAFPRAKITIERGEICEYDGHTLHKISQWHLTAEWLAPWESECSRMCSKVSSDWLPNYIKDIRPVLETFNVAGYIPNRPRIQTASRGHSAPYSLGTRVSSSQGTVVAGGKKLTTHSHLVPKVNMNDACTSVQSINQYEN